VTGIHLGPLARLGKAMHGCLGHNLVAVMRKELCELDIAMSELDTEAVPPIGGVDFLRDCVGTGLWCRKVFEIVVVQKPLRISPKWWPGWYDNHAEINFVCELESEGVRLDTKTSTSAISALKQERLSKLHLLELLPRYVE